MKSKNYWKILKIASIVLLIALIFPNYVFANPDLKSSKGSTTLQGSRIDIFTIEIPQLGDRSRRIQVYLPPDYDSSEKSYPAFYLLDGQNLFNPPPDSVGDYLVDETLDQLFREGKLDGVIVVGIEHDREHDWSEYMPWVNENMHDWLVRTNSAPVEGGEGFQYLDFIVQTLKPEIDSMYRTLPDREHTAIGGFCRLALIPVVAGVKYPDVFSGVMSMSPAVWLAEGGGRWLSNNQLIQYINQSSVPENVKFYIDIGTEESSGNRPPVRDQNGDRITYPQAYIEGAEALANMLQQSGVPKDKLFFQIIEGVPGTRDEWAKRLDEVILWFFENDKSGTIEPPEALPTQNIPDDENPAETKPVSDPQPNEGFEWPKPTIMTIGIIFGGFFIVVCLMFFLWLVFRR